MTTAKQLLALGVRNDDGCLIWPGAINSKGYGCVSINGRSHLVHRVIHTLAVSPIPAGHQVDHTCHDPEQCPGGIACPHRRCFDPAHLEAVTPAMNVRRASRSRCRRGHPLTLRMRGAAVVRVCRICEAVQRRQAQTARAG